MAKAPKNKKAARKKKPATVKTRNSDAKIVRVIQNTLDEMWYSFSSVEPNVIEHGLEKIARQLGGNRFSITPTTDAGILTDIEIAKATLLSTLSEDERDWRYWLSIFTDDGDEMAGHEIMGTINDAVLSDMSYVLPQMLQKEVDTFDLSKVKGWAWACTPSNVEHWNDNALAEYYQARDIFNQEKRKFCEEIHTRLKHVDLGNKAA